MDYDDVPVCMEWRLEREKHPFFGESFSEDRILSCWDRSAERYTGDNYSNIRASIIDDLFKMDILNDETAVLDIGCGPGLFALPFAECVKKVYCVDSSIPMIDRLVSNMGKIGVENIEVRHSTWESLDPIDGVDVAFTSLCPPLNDPISILRLEKFASEYCVYISSSNDDKGMNLEVWNRLGRKYSFKGYDTNYPYEFLKSQGREPELRFYSEILKNEQTVENAISSELAKIAQYRPVSSKIEGIVTDVVMSHQSNGYVNTEQEMRMGMLIWKPMRVF
jgi:SAM-dependent methyltransferase